MLLAVAPTREETEELRRTYAKQHCFVYCATHANMVRAAEAYRPNAILLKMPEVTELLLRKIERIRKVLPDVALITLSNEDVSAFKPDAHHPLRAQNRTLQFQAIYCLGSSPNEGAFKGSYIISGLLMVPFDKKVFLAGKRAHFSPEEVFLLRYLASIHPRRANADELGALCFAYGKKVPRSTVASCISRINREAERLISVPIIQNVRGEGYGIEF